MVKGAVHGEGGVCVVKEACGKGACMAKGTCMAKGVCGGGMHGRGVYVTREGVCM